MRIETAAAEAFTIYGSPKLDPITVVLQDFGPGAGRLIVECYGAAWSAYFGATGDRRIKQFLSVCDVDYLVGKLWSSNHKRTKRSQDYLARIVLAVLDAVRRPNPPAR